MAEELLDRLRPLEQILRHGLAIAGSGGVADQLPSTPSRRPGRRRPRRPGRLRTATGGKETRT